MTSVQRFYSQTDRWWGAAENMVDATDRSRASVLSRHCAPHASVLELGCGYGTTVRACAEAGYVMTGIDFSARIDRAPAGEADFVQADFYEHRFDRSFDAVTYWDGFGVGSDQDQRRLLDRIGREWLGPLGVAIVEVMDPTGWSADHGLDEIKRADPTRGYRFELGHRRTFDAATSIAADTWWELGSSTEWSQHLRCYSPAEFTDLVAGTPLRLAAILEQNRNPWAYTAVLKRS